MLATLFGRFQSKRARTSRTRSSQSGAGGLRRRPALEVLEDRITPAAPPVLPPVAPTPVLAAPPLPAPIVQPLAAPPVAPTQVLAAPPLPAPIAQPLGGPPAPGTPAASTTAAPATQILQLQLNPIDLNLLGLEVQTNQITVTVSAQPGPGNLLGNLLSGVGNLLNLQGVNTALNNVLSNVVSLLNASKLGVSGVSTTGSLGSSTGTSSTPILDLYVAPIHLDLLGVLVDTGAIHLTITAHSGPGLILGNLLTDVANLFNPPQPKLNLNTIDHALNKLVQEIDALTPGIPSAATAAAPMSAATSSQQLLNLIVPPINLNLLGLLLQTSQINVNVSALSGPGDLLGNLVNGLFKTLGATPRNIATLNNDLNAILGKVVGILNSSTLTLPANAVSSLDSVLQQLALPNLINTSGTSATAPILNLSIASTNSSPPINVNLLGLLITTSNIQLELLAQTGNGQILGNLLYNVANLLNPNGSSALFTILNELGL